ncbi:unnamed protein product [Rotaria sp. Silwood2]|nr:unnamed protein product [Rotaria sp. Silwood2]
MNSIILIIIIYILTIFHFFFIESSHFSGGTVTWKTIDNTTTGPIIPIMFTQLYQWWLLQSILCFELITSNSNNWRTFLDSSSGLISTVDNIIIGSKFCVAFQSNSWIGLRTVKCVTSGDAGASNTTTISTTTVASCYNSAAI